MAKAHTIDTNYGEERLKSALRRPFRDRIEDAIFEFIFALIPPLMLASFFLFAYVCLGAPTVDISAELDRTDQVIVEVEGLLPEQPEQLVLEQLELARSMQGEARDYYDQTQYMMALHLTMQAREIAQRLKTQLVSGSAIEVSSATKHLLRILEQNSETIEELAPVVDEFNNEPGRRNFAGLVELQNQAWALYESEQFEQSSALARVVNDRMAQIRQGIISDDRNLKPEKMTDDFDRADEALARASERVPEENSRAQSLLNSARNAFSEAEKIYSAGNPIEAKRLLDGAINLAQKSIEVSNASSKDGSFVLERLAKTDELISSAEEEISNSNSYDSKAVFEQSKILQNEARTAFDKDDFVSAENLTIQARNMSELALRNSRETGEISRTEVERAIAHAEELFLKVSAMAENSGNDRTAELLNRAENTLNDAKKNRDDGKFKEALTATRAASDYVQQAAKIIENR